MTMLTSWRGPDGVWHAYPKNADETLCGLPASRQQGRRRVPSCHECLAVIVAEEPRMPSWWRLDPDRPAAVIESALKPDPPVPGDGSCVVCGKQRKPERSRRYAKDAAERDPFCSSPCCRIYHGCELAVSGSEEQEEGGRMSAAQHASNLRRMGTAA